MMMMAARAVRKTLHRALNALPHKDLIRLAELYGVDLNQNRVNIQHALMAKDYPAIARKALTLLRRALEEEKP